MIAYAQNVVRKQNKYYPSLGSFFDQQQTEDGKPYGPIRFKQIVKERYLISKNINTSYNDIGKLTPIERKYILEFIADEIKRENEAFEKAKQESKKR